MTVEEPSTLEINIDGRAYLAREGETILDVARRNGIFIPALCAHSALGGEASCRLCVVEVEKGTRTDLQIACRLRAREGLGVSTASDEALSSRARTLSLLLARAPHSPLLVQMASELGVEAATVELQGEDCILCGLCVDTCAAVGVEVLQFLGRGAERKVVLVTDGERSDCIGCLACETLCPVQGASGFVQDGELVLPRWGISLPLERCARCGRELAPRSAQAYVQERAKGARARIDLCPECKRKAALAARFKSSAG
jgi:predicted molibdopterin-dependent oxidoreductase YjgC